MHRTAITTNRSLQLCIFIVIEYRFLKIFVDAKQKPIILGFKLWWLLLMMGMMRMMPCVYVNWCGYTRFHSATLLFSRFYCIPFFIRFIITKLQEYSVISTADKLVTQTGRSPERTMETNALVKRFTIHRSDLAANERAHKPSICV